MVPPDQLPPKSADRARRARIVTALLSALLLAVYLLAPPLSSMDSIRRRAESAAGAASGSEVHIEQLRLGYDLGLHLSKLSASEPGAAPFLTVDRATAYIAPRALLSGHPFTVKLQAPRIFVDRLPTSGETKGEMTLPFSSLEIEDGYFVSGDANEEIGPVTVSIDTIRAQQEVHASMQIDPQLPPLDVTAIVDTPGGKLSFDTLQVSWTGIPLAILAERFPAITGAGIEGTLTLSTQASGRLDQLNGNGSLSVHGLRYRTASVELGGEIDAPFTLNGNQITLPAPGLRVAGMTWNAAGLTGSTGEATLAGTITREGDILQGTGKLAINKVQGHDSSSERVIEAVTVNGTLESRWSSTEPVAVRINLAAAAGELLWDRIYADISRHPAMLACDVGTSAQGIDVTNIDARAKGIGTLKGNATLDATAAVQRLEAQIDVGDLDSVYALAVRDAYKESYPVLANTGAGGNLSIRAEYARTGDNFSVSGKLHLGNAMLSSTDPAFEVQGLTLDMPLQLGVAKGGAPQAGKLRIAAMRFGEIAVGEVAATLNVGANTVELGEPLSVGMLGGTIQIDELAFERIASAEPQARFGVMARNLDLEGLTRAMGLLPFRGTMSGAIPRVTVTSNEIRSDGEIRIRAFEGNIAVRNLSVEQLFSSVPTLGLDLDFDDISLNRLTETLEVGMISGVAHGAARNLKIVNGEPLSFDAWMETVERPGVPQRISVSAIRQLSILGGSGGDPFSQGVLGFFDEYRYAKMGFKCRLENDRFLLRGVETKDGLEYLVVGSRLPPRVNVVSHNQVISFSEMVHRLQRVTTAKAPEEEKGEQE